MSFEQESLIVTTIKLPWRTALILALPLVIIAGCSSGSSNKGSKQVPDAVSLDVADVERIIAQAVYEAKNQNKPATIGVIDRVGNVLAIYKMTGATAFITITSGSSVKGGLEGATGDPAKGADANEQAALIPENAVIAKALTAAYFSSKGNAFTSRSAAQVLQENFTPGEKNKPSGPLFGVQFSQLSCSDVAQRLGAVGPKRSPLGFAADPGGIPLYKNGSVVGAVAVMAGEAYSVDRDAADVDSDVDELIALAATYGYAPPEDIRADRITVEGRNLRFVDSEDLATNPANAPAYSTLTGTDGALVPLPGYFAGAIVPGVKFGLAESGVRPAAAGIDPPEFVDVQGYVVVNAADVNRFAPIDGATTGGQQLTAADVTALLAKSIEIANRARSQVRRPVGSAAQVHSVVVDTNGTILGALRSPDALVDAIDVVPQKARTAVFFSQTGAAAALGALPPANYLGTAGGGTSNISGYVTASQNFFGTTNIFADGTAFSTRSINNISTPAFPDGIAGKPNGPLAKPEGTWSIFNNGLNLDLVYNQIISFLVAPNAAVPATGCTGNTTIFNGITLFGGGIPIYKNGVLAGAIGSSGDGTEQSDLIAYLAVEQSGAAGVANAPKSIRADNLAPFGIKLRYVLCPFAPFNGSNQQNACGD